VGGSARVFAQEKDCWKPRAGVWRMEGEKEGERGIGSTNGLGDGEHSAKRKETKTRKTDEQDRLSITGES